MDFGLYFSTLRTIACQTGAAMQRGNVVTDHGRLGSSATLLGTIGSTAAVIMAAVVSVVARSGPLTKEELRSHKFVAPKRSLPISNS